MIWHKKFTFHWTIYEVERLFSVLIYKSVDAPTRRLDKLHSVAVLQIFQTNMLTSEEAGLDAASLRDLRSMTDLALRATKDTAQAIGRSMSKRIVLEHRLWFTMTDKVPFLDAPVSSGSLFGPAVEGCL